MPEVAVVSDSVACLTRELAEQYGIVTVPINFIVSGKVYRDWVDVTPSEAYDLFLQDPDSFKSSAPSPQDCLDAIKTAANSAPDIIFITASLKLTSVYTSANQARELAMSELPSHRIEVLDSYTATAAEGFIVLAAARAAAENKDLDTVLAAAVEVKNRVQLVMVLDTIRYVYRSGRIPKIAAQVGSVLNIRPLLTIRDGKVEFVGAVRNKAHGIERVLEITRSKVQNNPVHIAVMHSYDLEEAQKLKERVAAEFNCVEIWISEFSPVMGYATGTGTVGLAFYTEPNGK